MSVIERVCATCDDQFARPVGIILVFSKSNLGLEKNGAIICPVIAKAEETNAW